MKNFKRGKGGGEGSKAVGAFSKKHQILGLTKVAPCPAFPQSREPSRRLMFLRISRKPRRNLKEEENKFKPARKHQKMR